jgi:hypothetical protein
VLRLVWYADDKPALRYEFRDVVALSGDGSEFVLDIPPGVRVVRTSGGPLGEIDMPDAVRFAMRSAGSAAKAAGSGISAVRGFLDSLRGQGRS